MEIPEVVIDTSVLVGLIDSQDTWHDTAWVLRNALTVVQVRLVYFDCDFDRSTWLIRLYNPEGVREALPKPNEKGA